MKIEDFEEMILTIKTYDSSHREIGIVFAPHIENLVMVVKAASKLRTIDESDINDIHKEIIISLNKLEGKADGVL